jgi:zona occludens toxin
MLALLSGIPGYGKTAHGIDWVFFQDSEFKDLDRYVEGVSELDIVKCPHFEFPLLADLKKPDYVPLSVVDGDLVDGVWVNGADSEKYMPWLPSHPEYADFVQARALAKHPLELWFLWATPKSVLLIDESQRFYRPRPSGSKVPLHISMLEYHRHFAIHFLAITQAPRLMDLHFRSLVEKHVHLDKNWKGGFKHEWAGAKDIESKADLKSSAKTKYSPPSHVFGLYKSATMHLKVKHKKPVMFYLIIFAFLAFIALLYFGISFIRSHNPSAPKKDLSPLAAGLNSPLGNGVNPASSVTGSQTMDDYLNQFKAVVPARPESAPAYQPLRVVSSMPRISACLMMANICKCYSQQGSYLPEILPERCEQILKQGDSFNPYLVDSMPVNSPVDRISQDLPSVSVPVVPQPLDIRSRSPISEVSHDSHVNDQTL